MNAQFHCLDIPRIFVCTLEWPDIGRILLLEDALLDFEDNSVLFFL